jgi:hypothetical protein
MEPQPVRPLDYATPQKRAKSWLILAVIVGAVAACVMLLGSIGFMFFHVSTPRSITPLSPLSSAAVQTTRAASFVVNLWGDKVGPAPTTFVSALTGGGGPVTWVIVPDGDKTVLAQTSTDSTDYRFPLCVFNGLTAKDVEVSSRFKAVSGKVDQAGGLVVRYQNKDNYYVVRANALENNVRLYRVIDGNRTQFAGADVKVSSGEWHDLTLVVKGSHFNVVYEGMPLFEADDSAIGNAGQVGLWTKADSVTEFDLLTVNPD